MLVGPPLSASGPRRGSGPKRSEVVAPNPSAPLALPIRLLSPLVNDIGLASPTSGKQQESCWLLR